MLRKNEMHGMREHLETIEKSGTVLYLDGKQTTADEVVACCVNEEAVYMPDYVLDESGRLAQLRYDRVRMF